MNGTAIPWRIFFYRIPLARSVKNRTPPGWMIPQYRTLKSKFSKYPLKKSSIPQYRKPHVPLLNGLKEFWKKKQSHKFLALWLILFSFIATVLLVHFIGRMEQKFFLHDVKKRMVTLFGSFFLSPTLTFKLKIQTWWEVRNHLVAAGFPPRTKEQLRNGRTCRWPRPVRPNTPNESRLGRVL